MEEYDSSQQLVDSAEGLAYLAKDPEDFQYDDDGNLKEDGRWKYTWDAENRLVEMEEIRTDHTWPELPMKVEFTYDYMGRRVETVLWLDEEPGFGQWIEAERSRYMWSNWRMIAELSGTGNSLEKSFLWGLDLAERAGAPYSISEGAGGVGGLLMVASHGSGGSEYYAWSDGNGNVVGLFDWAGNGDVSATYDYGAFGETIRASGPAADVSPFRFSTKYEDSESGFLYYGYRFYSPSIGRFLNRDPMEEEGGLNLYAFVQNDPVNNWDFFGLCSSWKLSNDAKKMSDWTDDSLTYGTEVKKFATVSASYFFGNVSVVSEAGLSANYSISLRSYVVFRCGQEDGRIEIIDQQRDESVAGRHKRYFWHVDAHLNVTRVSDRQMRVEVTPTATIRKAAEKVKGLPWPNAESATAKFDEVATYSCVCN